MKKIICEGVVVDHGEFRTLAGLSPRYLNEYDSPYIPLERVREMWADFTKIVHSSMHGFNLKKTSEEPLPLWHPPRPTSYSSAVGDMESYLQYFKVEGSDKYDGLGVFVYLLPPEDTTMSHFSLHRVISHKGHDGRWRTALHGGTGFAYNLVVDKKGHWGPESNWPSLAKEFFTKLHRDLQSELKRLAR